MSSIVESSSMFKYFLLNHNKEMNCTREVHAIMISYEPLWATMRQKEISTYALIHKHGIDAHTINNLKHNQSITMNTLESLCTILNCTPNDVVRFIPAPKDPEA